MIKKTSTSKRLFVLDTNVLMHDPTALFHFDEHDIFLPMVVLEELDHGKKGLSEVSQNVRQVSRFLDELMLQIDDPENISQGIPLPSVGSDDQAHGRLFFQTTQVAHNLLVRVRTTADII